MLPKKNECSCAGKLVSALQPIYTTISNRSHTGVNFIFISRQGVIDDVHTFNPTTA